MEEQAVEVAGRHRRRLLGERVSLSAPRRLITTICQGSGTEEPGEEDWPYSLFLDWEKEKRDRGGREGESVDGTSLSPAPEGKRRNRGGKGGVTSPEAERTSHGPSRGEVLTDIPPERKRARVLRGKQ